MLSLVCTNWRRKPRLGSRCLSLMALVALACCVDSEVVEPRPGAKLSPGRWSINLNEGLPNHVIVQTAIHVYAILLCQEMGRWLDYRSRPEDACKSPIGSQWRILFRYISIWVFWWTLYNSCFYVAIWSSISVRGVWGGWPKGSWRPLGFQQVQSALLVSMVLCSVFKNGMLKLHLNV